MRVLPKPGYSVEVCLLFACFVMLLSGCGGSSRSGQAAPIPGNTQVTVLATSTANGQLAQFDLSFNSLKLTSESGNTVDLIPAIEHGEFIHKNGSPEPFFTTSVLEDTYTSATAQIGPERISCMGALPNGENAIATGDYGFTPDNLVKVILPQPIKLSGSSMLLMLGLDVSRSASWTPPCPTARLNTLTPTLSLTAVPANSVPTLRGMTGLISAINASSGAFTVTAGDGPWPGYDSAGTSVMWPAPKWTVAVNSGTRFSGVSKFSDLAAPMPVIIDGSLQDDGSVLATHISILDTDMEKLNVFRGPLGRVDNSRPAIMALGTEQYGYFDDTNGGFGFLGTTAFGYSNASFQIGAGPTSNLSHLPFAPSFDATSMVAGQSISITWHGDDQPALPYLPTASVTLLPQTINGTVQSVSTEGEFQKYIIALPGYDLFPQLATEAMQISPLTDPGTVIVYADSNTARNNTQPIATGSVFRFNGLVFNDAGTLRMACNSVSDGVPE